MFFIFIFFSLAIHQLVLGHVRVYIFDQPISDELAEYLGIKTEYTPLAVVRLVNIYI